MEPEELNASLDKITNHNIPSASTTTLNTTERELPNGSTKSFSDVVCGIMENNILSTEYDKYCRTSQQIPTVINDENNNDCNSRQEKTLQNVFSDNGQNLKFPVNIPKRRILKMLDSVSYNIIEVWKCYHTIKPYNKYKNNHRETSAVRSFLKYRYYCFNCSYLAVDLIIIPNEDNQTFIEKFINRTVILAHGMYLFQITRETVLDIMKDMISWSKYAMQNKINLESKVQNQKSMESSKNNVDKICIFSSGTEDRQLSISIAPELLKKHLNCETVKVAHKHKQQKESNRGQTNILADNASHEKNDDNFHKKRSRTSAKKLSISTLSAPQENLSNTVLLGNDLETINLLTDDVNDQNPNARSSISRDSGFVSPVYRPPSRDPKVNRSFRVIININLYTY